MHNMSHALTAYFGALRGYTYIWEAIQDSDIKELASEALKESSRALNLEYGVEMQELEDFSNNLIERFENKLLGDTIERVGKDTKRKLSINDRFVGVALLCQKQGTLPKHILAGLSAGLHFAKEGDDASIEVSTFARECGVKEALEKYCGISPTSTVAEIVEDYYDKIKNNIALSELV